MPYSRGEKETESAVPSLMSKPWLGVTERETAESAVKKAVKGKEPNSLKVDVEVVLRAASRMIVSSGAGSVASS